MSPNVIAGLGAQHALAQLGRHFCVSPLSLSVCVCVRLLSVLRVCGAECEGAAGRGRVWKRHASSNQQND